MLEAALAYLEHSREIDHDGLSEMYEDLIRLQRRRLEILHGDEAHPAAAHPDYQDRYGDVLRHVRGVQRATILHLFNHHEINEDTMRRLEYELDLMDAQFDDPEHG